MSDSEPEGQQGPNHLDPPDAIPWAKILFIGAFLVALLSLSIIIVVGPQTLNSDKKIRLEGLKLVLAGIAGYGAAVTVWLALRRQAHTEANAWTQRVLDDAKQKLEAEENVSRRSLEIYSAATNQLASDQPAVRLAGLFAFNQLANDVPAYRQTVVDVYCAYLRMPLPPPSAETDALVSAEVTVRTTLQHVLTRHFAASAEGGDDWSNIRLNLSKTVLFNFDATSLTLRNAVFVGVTFQGATKFDFTRFHSVGAFDHCQFHGSASFRNARFLGGASFVKATFHSGETDFTGTRFRGDQTSFFRSSFLANQVSFRAAKFASIATTTFQRSRFVTKANFRNTFFTSQKTSFLSATFNSPPLLDRTHIRSDLLLVHNVEDWTAWLRAAAFCANGPTAPLDWGRAHSPGRPAEPSAGTAPPNPD